MKKKMGIKLTAILTAFLITNLIMMTGCGSSTEGSKTDETLSSATEASVTTESKNVGIKTDEKVLTSSDDTKDETEPSSETTTESGTDSATENEKNPEPSAEADELAAIKKIAENGYAAAISNNYEDMVKYVNLDVMWFMANGEWLSDAEIAEKLNEASKGTEVGFDMSGNLSTSFEELEDLEFTDVKLCTDEELQEINNFLQMLGAEEGRSLESLIFTKAYKLSVTYSNMSEAEAALMNSDKAPCLYVLEYNNGTTKLDMCVTLLMELYRAFEELDWGDAAISSEG